MRMIGYIRKIYLERRRFTDGTANPEEYLTALQFLSECLKNDLRILYCSGLRKERRKRICPLFIKAF